MDAAWRKILPCSFTFAALCAGVGSILAAGEGSFLLSAQLILVSLILDGLDGTLARLLRAQIQLRRGAGYVRGPRQLRHRAGGAAVFL